MKTCKEHDISRDIVDTYVGSGENFTWKEAIKGAIAAGGFNEVFPGYHIRSYLENLADIGVLERTFYDSFRLAKEHRDRLEAETFCYCVEDLIDNEK